MNAHIQVIMKQRWGQSELKEANLIKSTWLAAWWAVAFNNLIFI